MYLSTKKSKKNPIFYLRIITFIARIVPVVAFIVREEK